MTSSLKSNLWLWAGLLILTVVGVVTVLLPELEDEEPPESRPAASADEP